MRITTQLLVATIPIRMPLQGEFVGRVLPRPEGLGCSLVRPSGDSVVVRAAATAVNRYERAAEWIHYNLIEYCSSRMGQSLSRLLVHSVFSTKDLRLFLRSEETRSEIYAWGRAPSVS
jgi:hypothetical protein